MLISTIPINVLIVSLLIIFILVDVLRGISVQTASHSITSSKKRMDDGLNNSNPRYADSLLKNKINNCSCNHKVHNNRNDKFRDIFRQFWPYSKIEEYLKYLNETYPERTNLLSLGSTAENRTIYVVSIGISMEGNNVVFINAGMHSKEWNGIMMALYIIYALVECKLYADIGFIDWLIMPVVNPDGYVYSFTHSKHRMWIKNRKPCQKGRRRCETGQDCGVNIDKNFPYMFPAGVGASSNPCSDFYSGGTDGSEIESSVTMNLLASIKDRLKLYLGLRTYGSLILYPFAAGFNIYNKFNNNQELRDFAVQITQAINEHVTGEENYTYGQYAEKILPETGTSLDYAKGTLGVQFVYYIYLRGPHQSKNTEILPIVKECFYGVCYMVKEIYKKFPAPKKFLRKLKGFRRRRRQRNAAENRSSVFYILQAIIMYCTRS